MKQAVAIFKPHMAKPTAFLSRWQIAENSSCFQESKLLSALFSWAKTLISDTIIFVN